MPLIDPRSYADIVREAEALAAAFTAQELEPASPELRGQTLSEAVLDPVTQQVIAADGTVVEAVLAERLSRVPGLGLVKVRGWQPAIVTTVPPVPEALHGHILHQDIRDGLTQKLLFPAGKFIDTTLAQQISQISGLTSVSVMTGPDAGQALIRLFAHFTGLLIDRLNRAPDKNFLAFLDLIGTRLLPPQPARVPLTFRLASGSQVDAFVPASTPVASPAAEGEEEETVFETERDLVVTRAQLVSVIVRDADRDCYADYTDRALGIKDAVFPALEVEAESGQLVEHSLYLAHDRFFSLPNLKKLTLTLASPDAAHLAALPISWSVWNGQAWQPLTVQMTLPANQWQVVIDNPPAPQAREVNGRSATWLRARLEAALPQDRVTVLDNLPRQIRRQDFKPEAVRVRNVLVDPGEPFFPFGDKDPLSSTFAVNVEEAFLRGGALVTLKVDLAAPVAASNDLGLEWTYKDGSQPKALGRSGSAAALIGATDAAFSDGTLGLTRSGEISFRVPLNWTSENIGRNGRWLTVQVMSGAYRQPPQIRAITVSYTWELPRLGRLILAAQTGQSALTPELAFANTTQVDLSKDFYPFGSRPYFNDTLYLAHSAALSQAKARVTLDVTLSNPSTATTEASPIPRVGAQNAVLAWEVWDGRAWQAVGQSGSGTLTLNPNPFNFSDTTKAFTVNGQVAFDLPSTMGPGSVNGETNSWLRVRLIRGDYGKDAYYTSGSGNSATYVASTLAPPSIQKMSLGYTAQPPAETLSVCYTYNDFAYVDCTTLAAEGKSLFLPFTPTPDTQPTLYLGFDRSFGNRPTVLYARVEAPLPEEVMAGIRRNVIAPPSPRLVWEYSGPQGWTQLGVQDETHTFAERGLINFMGPADFTAQSQFGQPRYWLRARWTGGVFQVRPRLRRWLTNTVWAGQASTVSQEMLGSSNGNANQTFTTSRAPVLLGQQLEVRERELPSAEELAELETQAGHESLNIVLDASGQADEIWVRWREVPDFYASGPNDRHYTLDHLTGEIRFGDGQHGLAPPQGRNNIRLAFYRTGGGERGDRAVGTITQLKSTVPYVDGVTNLEAAGGGADRESLESVKERGPRTLRHRGRAVTAQDFVDLAYEASPDVARAFAVVPESNPLELKWLDPKTPAYPKAVKLPDAGHVGLVIVPYSVDPRPIPSLDLINRVEAYVRERATPSTDLWVAGPDWLRVSVTAEVVPVSLAAGEGLGATVMAALRSFLHPLTGGPEGQGWAFGRRPQLSDFYAVIEDWPGVDHVRALSFTEEPEELVPGRFLIFSGEHVIRLISPEGEA